MKQFSSKTHTPSILILIFIFLSILILFAGCSSTKEIYSDSAVVPYHVDGRASEWYGKRMIDFKDEGLLVGIQNDTHNVYLCLMSSNRSTSRLMVHAGVIIWFKSEDGKKFGIHYPIRQASQPVDAYETYEPTSYTDLDFLGPENDAINRSSTLTSENEYGISAACGDSLGTTVIELKIPRTSQRSLKINIESGTSQNPSGIKHHQEESSWTLGNESSSEGDNLENSGGTHRSGRPGRGGGYNGKGTHEGQKPAGPISLNLQVWLK